MPHCTDYLHCFFIEFSTLAINTFVIWAVFNSIQTNKVTSFLNMNAVGAVFQGGSMLVPNLLKE